jgi:hypothetical protein
MYDSVVVVKSCRENIVGTATRCRLDSPNIESRWVGDFPHDPDQIWDQPTPLYNEYRVSFLI